MIRLVTSYIAGGLETSRKLFDALGNTGKVEVTSFVPREINLDPVYSPNGRIEVAKEELHATYRVVPLPLKDPVQYYRGFRIDMLYRALKEAKPDLVHVIDEPFSPYLFQAVWLARIAAPRAKVLFYGWENLPFTLPTRARIKWQMTWTMVAGGVAVNSESIRNLRAAGFPRSRPLETVFWGIPTDIFRPLNEPSLKAVFGFENAHLVGFVGRRVVEKGIGVLLEAIRHLPGEVHCLMIGSGPNKHQLLDQYECWDLAERLHVRDTVEAKQLTRYINCMDVLVLPSITTPRWKEQFGRVLPEAMACRVPVVGSTSGAIPEVIGDAGLVVPENDPRALSDAVFSVIFDETRHAELVRRGIERVRSSMSIGAMVDRLISFYDKVIQTESRRPDS